MWKEGVFYVEKQVLLTQSLGTADIKNVRSFFFNKINLLLAIQCRKFAIEFAK